MTKRLKYLAILFLLLAGWGVAGAKKPEVVPQEEPDSVMYLSTDSFLTRVCDLHQSQWKYLGQKPCVIDFYTTWCGWCRKMSPAMEALAEKYKGQVYFYKVDAERERNVAAAFGINSYPQVIYCPMGDKQPTLTKGYMSQENIEKIIQEVLLK